MIYSPIWKDNILETTSTTLNYRIRDLEAVRFIENNYTKAMPGQTGVTLCINNKVDDRLNPDFSVTHFPSVTNQVVSNPNAVRTFRVLNHSENDLGTYKFLYDWSYEDNWSGQSEHNMSEPMRPIDPRMKAMFTIYNTAQTSFDWTIEYPVKIKLSSKRIVFGAGSDDGILEVRCNADWTITSMPSWLSADVTAGTGVYSAMTPTTVTFTSQENPDDIKREGEIVFTHCEGSVTIPVMQYGIYLTVTPLYTQFPVTGGTNEIEIRYNYKWTKTTSIDWLGYGGDPYVELDGRDEVRTMRMTLTVSSSSAAKSGEITFSQGNISRVLSVEKQGYTFDISPMSITLPETGGNSVVGVTANTSWKITSVPSWITSSIPVNTVVPGGVTSITFTAGANDSYFQKSGQIVFDYSGSTKSISATQGTTLTVTPGQLFYATSGGSRTITVKSVGVFHISGATSELLSFSSTSGYGTTQITVNCASLSTPTVYGDYTFDVYNQYTHKTVGVRQGQALSGATLHTTYLATASTTAYYGLFDESRSTSSYHKMMNKLSIDGGPAVDVSNSYGYGTYLEPGIHTVDYVVNTPGQKYQANPWLFSKTALYTLEADDNIPSNIILTLQNDSNSSQDPSTNLVSYVKTGGLYALYCSGTENLTKLDIGNSLQRLHLTGCYGLNQSLYLPASCWDVEFTSPRGFTRYSYPMDTSVPGPFIQVSGFTGEATGITSDGRGFVTGETHTLTATACGGLTAYTIPSGVEKLYMCFVESPIEKLTIPEGVKEIWGASFQFSNISDFNIPSSVTAVTYQISNFEWWVRQTGPLCIKDGWLVSTKGFTGSELIVPDGVIGMTKMIDYGGSDSEYYGKSDVYNSYTAVTKVVLPSTLKYLTGGDMFRPRWPSSGYGWNSLSEIYCYAPTPPAITADFYAILSRGTLHCPVGSNYSAWMNAGLSTYGWTVVYDL